MRAELDALLRTLHAEKSLKVWSLIMTFFGDAIVPRGGAVSARTLRTVMERLGAESGAVRTALSRLASDGWVERERRGRTSFYRLSAAGFAPFAAAAERIYAPPAFCDPQPGVWLLAIAGRRVPEDTLADKGGVALNTNCFIFAQPSDDVREHLQAAQWLTVEGELGTVPVWVKNMTGNADLASAYRRLQARFVGMSNDNNHEPLDAVAARCLLVHEWRRLLLRTPHVHSALLPDDWPAGACGVFVAELYHSLTKAAEGWLDAEATGPDGALHARSNEIEARFR